jgi:hypothetical protein
LKVVGSVEKEPDYDFNMFVVWESVADKTLYMGSDSGCSCPSPFEDVGSIEGLERIGSYDQFSRALDSWKPYGELSGGQASVASLRRKVRRRLART